MHDILEPTFPELSYILDQSLFLSFPEDYHNPQPYVIGAWWTSSTGYEAYLKSPPGVGDRRWLMGCDLSRSEHWGHPGQDGFT